MILSKIRGIQVQTENMPRLVEFYRDVLGLVPRKPQTGAHLELCCGDTYLQLIEAQRLSVPLHIMFSLSASHLRSARNKLSSHSIHFTEDSTGIHLSDPDGNLITLEPQAEAPQRPGAAGSSHGQRKRLSDSENGWTRLYEDMPVEQMPWYSERMDSDLTKALHTFIPMPSRLIELGSGPGILAAQLAAMGHEVVGVDIAPKAIAFSRKRFGDLNPRLRYEVADVTALPPELGTFDHAVDRGCFHSLPPEKRGVYIRSVRSVLRPGGRLILKTFSRDEPGDWGPHRFDIEELKELFRPAFQPVFCEKGVFDGGRLYPKAILMVFELS